MLHHFMATHHGPCRAWRVRCSSRRVVTKSFWHVARLTGLAVVCTCALAAVHYCTADPGRAAASVEVLWPKGRPRGILVFLHGFSRDPWVEERDGINELSSFAARRGFITLVPLGDGRCQRRSVRCWSLDDIEDEVDAIDDVVRGVETRGRPLERRIVGFSSGGFFLGAALERDLLDDYTRVGIIGGGAVGQRWTSLTDVPPTFLELGRDDDENRGAMRSLERRLLSRDADDVHVREVAGGRALTSERARHFIRWFWGVSPSTKEPATTSMTPTPTTAMCP